MKNTILTKKSVPEILRRLENAKKNVLRSVLAEILSRDFLTIGFIGKSQYV